MKVGVSIEVGRLNEPNLLLKGLAKIMCVLNDKTLQP